MCAQCFGAEAGAGIEVWPESAETGTSHLASHLEAPGIAGSVRATELQRELESFQQAHPYRSVRVSGKSWPYLLGGAGERTFLLLPGSTLVPEVYFMLLEEIERDFRALALAYPPAFSVAEYIRGVDAILGVEDAQSAVLLGSSFGGYLAQCYVRARPDRISHLILAQTGARHFAGTSLLRLYARLLPTLPEPLARRLAWSLWMHLFEFPPEEREFWGDLMRGIMFGRLSKEHLAGHAQTLLDFAEGYTLSSEDLARWPGETLILESERDEVFGPAARAELRTLYPGAQVRAFSGTGHSAIVMEPRKHVDAIRDFLGAR